jgi:hypothetical protein
MSTEVEFFASATRTSAATAVATVAAPESEAFKGLWLALNATEEVGTATLDVRLQRYDYTSGQYVDIPDAALAQVTATGTTEFTIYPGIAETANVSVSDHVSDVVRARATIGGTSTPSFAYSLAGRWLK